MAARLLSVFSDVGRRAAAEYERGGTVDAAMANLERDIGSVFQAHYDAVMERFASRVYEQRKLERFISFSRLYYENFGAEKVVGISATTRRQIRAAIAKGEENGEGVDAIARLIRERTGGAIGRARSATIARTETHAAASYATHEATKELNLPAQRKRWVSVNDGRTRFHHAAANGQEVGIDEQFVIRYKGQEIRMMHPHDGSGGAANNINCRCLAIYFTDEDALFDEFAREGGEVSATPRADLKPEIDLYDIASGPLRDGLNKYFNSLLTPLAARIAAKFPKPAAVVTGKGKGVYMRSKRLIETDLDRLTVAHEYGHHLDLMINKAEAGASTLFMWSREGLREAWLADRRAFGTYRKSPAEQRRRLLEVRRELFDVSVRKIERPDGSIIEFERREGIRFGGADALSDIVDSFTGGKFYHDYGGYGHGRAYWAARRDDGPQAEVFANFYSIMDQPMAVEWAEKNLPNLWAAFIAKMRELDASDT